MTSNVHTIRSAVVERLRQAFPDGRIMFELNMNSTGSRRVDVACVTENTIVMVEIKSNTDNLKRLSEQVRAFEPCCHALYLALDARHSPEFHKFKYAHDLWSFDDGKLSGECRKSIKIARIEPHASRLLHLLWTDELYRSCKREGINANKSTARDTMVAAMSWYLSGQQVAALVCQELRSRPMAEADGPISPALPDIVPQEDLF